MSGRDILVRLPLPETSVMLCGYNHPLYTSYLWHWRKVEIAPLAETMGRKAARRCEVIWMNYEADGKKIRNNTLLIAKRFVDVMGGLTVGRRYLDRMMPRACS